jgi:dienelactone hydrolase
MVLVHGGGGTAFANWVRLWNDRGYAAIAMDTCGCVPRGTYGHWERDELGGPAGWGGFDQTDQQAADQWTYHAVADILLAHSLIRSYPEVDPERTGITGISWGGYLTCIAAGVDPRFKLGAPVYGCGYLGEDSAWLDTFAKMSPETAAEWLRRWDPSVYLPRAAMPMLWVTGTNDFAYPMDSLQKSYRLPTGPLTLCIRVRMPHGHGPAGEGPEEIRTFADSILNGGTPLPAIIEQGRDGNQAWVKFKSQRPVLTAELTFTKQTGKWQDRLWETVPATIDGQTSTVTAQIPEGVTVYYFNLFEEKGQTASSEHQTTE